MVVQVTVTSVTLLLAVVPFALAIAQVCEGFVGCVWTVTAYGLPELNPVGKVKLPSAATLSVCAPALSESTRPVPERPLTLPPIVNAFANVAVTVHAAVTEPVV